MKVLAITQPTATWLLAKADMLNALGEALPLLASSMPLQRAVLLLGPLRASSTEDGSVVAIWHSDYLNATGSESWGLMALSGRHGALGTDWAEDIFRTALVVFDARLQNLLLPTGHLVRPHSNSISTCLVGVGNNKRQASLGYLESNNPQGRSVLVVGPAESEGNLDKSLAALVETLEAVRDMVVGIAASANQLILAAKRRPAADDTRLSTLRDRVEERRIAALKPEVYQPRLTRVYETAPALTYDEWTAPNGPLSGEKRAILEGDLLDHQPLRIVGPAGSGKSLLMQLMAVRVARRAASTGSACRVLYVAHNSSSMNLAEDRFETLWPADMRPENVSIQVRTLLEYCREELQVDPGVLLDRDAAETKGFQRAIVAEALAHEIQHLDAVRYPLLAQACTREELFNAVVTLVINEIGVVIKGHRLSDNPRMYVEAERPWSRFHALLTTFERAVVINVFESYHAQVFETAGYLDSDDLALSTLSRLRTPVWALRRKALGYDYVYVDEAQLYNENERRLFQFLTRRATGNLPIAIALDEAQNLTSSSVSGFGMIGIQSLRDEALTAVYRSTRDILRLAFHLIQRTTDLFGAEFPDFTEVSKSIVPSEHSLARPPRLVVAEDGDIGFLVLECVRELRKQNMWRIGVVVHAERYMRSVMGRLETSGEPVVQIAQRGQKLDAKRPVIAVASPGLVGGQEFEGVIAVGIERGVVPPKVGIDGLATSLEQQALRELYLSFTRARYQLILVNAAGSQVSALLDSAISEGLLVKVRAI